MEPGFRLRAVHIEDDVLADSSNLGNPAAGQQQLHLGDGSLEGLRLGAEPGGVDPLAADAFINSVGDGFYFRQLGHGTNFIVAEAAVLESMAGLSRANRWGRERSNVRGQ